MLDNTLGKKAEKKVKEWLDKPEEGYCFDRLNDQMTGFYGSKNICDFTLFKSPFFYYIESKATVGDRFDFSMISDFQYDNMLKKSTIAGVYGVIVVLFSTHQKAFLLDIRDIAKAKSEGIKSINIKKIDKWSIRYKSVQMVPSRKELLDYGGDFETLFFSDNGHK